MSVCVRASVYSLLWWHLHFIFISFFFCLSAQSEFCNATHTLKLSPPTVTADNLMPAALERLHPRLAHVWKE